MCTWFTLSFLKLGIVEDIFPIILGMFTTLTTLDLGGFMGSYYWVYSPIGGVGVNSAARDIGRVEGYLP